MITLVYSKHRINFYINAIKKTTSKNKQVLFLVPEIEDINFWKSYLKKYFSKGIFVLSSNLTEKQRYKIWEKAKSNEAKIILGTKLALFLPFKKLGLIILDKEESVNYNSFEKHPYYNGKDLAIKLSKLLNAKVILGASCPSIESYYLTRKNKYKIITNNIKYSTSSIHIIDMKNEIKNGNSSIFSKFLQNSIEKIISSGKKAILFVNRRGISTCLLCMDCGYIIKCPNCDVPLVYHKNLPLIEDKSFNTGYKLICHHCGHQQNPPSLCPKCKSYRIRYLGTGTQKIEYELKKISPNATAVRLDTDIAKTKQKQKEILEKFKNGNINFLVCTQLIFSYLKQLPRLDLISIVNISHILNLPDFKTGENAFRTISTLISHLSPREFIVQTYDPENYVIKYASENNYDKFFSKEIKDRKELNYPPFSRLIKLTYQHKISKKAEEEARILGEKLKQQLKVLSLSTKSQDMDFEILGPAPCFIPKIKNKWRWKIVIKIKCKKFLNGNIYLSERQVKIRNDLLKIIPNNWKIEIDPDTLL